MKPKNKYAQKLVPIWDHKVTFLKDFKNMELFSFLRLSNHWNTYECLNGENFMSRAL